MARVYLLSSGLYLSVDPPAIIPPCSLNFRKELPLSRDGATGFVAATRLGFV